MAEYYVDATGGDDGNDGLSEENAWQTISKDDETVLFEQPGHVPAARSRSPGRPVAHRRGRGPRLRARDDDTMTTTTLTTTTE